MVRKYSDREMRNILARNIEASPLVEEKIQEAYEVIRADAVKTAVAEAPAKVVVFSKKSRKIRRFLPVAAACVLLASTVSAMAYSGFFTKTKEQTADTLTYEFDVNYELLPYRMTVTPGYIPEGYKDMDGSGQKFCKDDYWQNGISLCVMSADWLGMNENTLSADNVKSVEETTINGMDADLITLNYDKERVTRTFDKRIYMFNSQEGYVGIVYGGNDISMEELVKVAENLVFTKTDQQVEPVDLKKLEKEKKAQAEYEKKQQAWIAQKYEEGIPAERVFDKGESFTWGWDDVPYELTVLECQVLDSGAALALDGFNEYEMVAARMNEDKTLKPYDRETFRGWAPQYGSDEPEMISREEAEQKFVTVKMQVTNPGDETRDFWAGAPVLQSLKEEKDGKYPYDDIYTKPYNMEEYGIPDRIFPVYFDGSLFEAPNNHFFYRELAPGETITYTLAYIVDADRIDNMYLSFGGGISAEPEMDEYYERYVKIK